MRLTREVRCFLPAAVLSTQGGAPLSPLNSWAGTNGPVSAAPFLVLRAEVEGPVDSCTGYLCDIKDLDALLRGPVSSRLAEAAAAESSVFPQRLAAALQFGLAGAHAPRADRARVQSLEIALSPFTRLRASTENTAMIYLTQSFEFSAAHRLYCPQLSDEENRRMFGKCSNPNGHGHNYVLEVTLAGQALDQPGSVIDLPTLDREVRRRVIEPLDHKNLNVECPEFAALNPTVENIARVIWTRLQPAFKACRLECVRVWETPKTCAEYRGDQPL